MNADRKIDPADWDLCDEHETTFLRGAQCPKCPPEDPGPRLFYMQFAETYCGDDVLWWRQGKCGYTTYIENAHVWTHAEAAAQASIRPTIDVPWSKSYIDANAHSVIGAGVVSGADPGAWREGDGVGPGRRRDRSIRAGVRFEGEIETVQGAGDKVTP